jgi:hypothetical protein
MAEALTDVLQKVDDEASFLRFLRLMIEDCEKGERECRAPLHQCQEMHWESFSTKDFLRSAEEWGHGDFGEGQHYGEPMLRRVATLLYSGRFRLRERPADRDDDR